MTHFDQKVTEIKKALTAFKVTADRYCFDNFLPFDMLGMRIGINHNMDFLTRCEHLQKVVYRHFKFGMVEPVSFFFAEGAVLQYSLFTFVLERLECNAYNVLDEVSVFVHLCQGTFPERYGGTPGEDNVEFQRIPIAQCILLCGKIIEYSPPWKAVHSLFAYTVLQDIYMEEQTPSQGIYNEALREDNVELPPAEGHVSLEGAAEL
ncbi:hypothetical protein EDM53_04170 [Rickettsiales endosymbiont of Peranema trichophorum]|uniref:hypothetical protein n=1 Tax=Rickettsiales endosymbiont of Peranema trichophorum TaxID=2486577 RepID=UPI0010234E7E|nr:hypothetical protein [Rickettsiales endosymbiont of Peranema trichophorum]RZI46328.1 hypothetical protein EDM53_04170 [Rickettsiales endosymbiont of Peranema trichophorum]